MIAIITKDGKTAPVQLPVRRQQLAGVLSFLGLNFTTDSELKYRFDEEGENGLMFSVESYGDAETAIERALPVGLTFGRLNDSFAMMDKLPYVKRREIENEIGRDGLESYEQFERMLSAAYPQSVVSKFYCPLTVRVHETDRWGNMDEDGIEEDAEFAARYEDRINQKLREYADRDDDNMAEYFYGHNGVSEKLRSVEWGFESRKGALYGCITVETAASLTEDEELDLKRWISGQNSDGIGEGFEQQEIYFENGRRGAFMYVSLWNPDDDYYIDNEDEFAERLDQGMTIGGM